MSFKAVIFDMDGTLLNTLRDIGEAANRTLAAQNYPAHPLEQYKYFVGEGAAKLIERALPEGEKTEKNIEKCLDIFLNDYRETWNNNTEPYEGIREMLDALSAGPVRTAILSNKPHRVTTDCQNKALSEWKFEHILGQRAGIPPKPDPAGALEIAEKMELPPSDFLYLGDTAVDMKTASAAGMFPAGVLWGFRSREELLANGAKELLNHPMEILKLLK